MEQFVFSATFETSSVEAIEIRSKILQENWDEFKDAHWKVISGSDESDLITHENTRAQAESIYLRVIEECDKRLAAVQPVNVGNCAPAPADANVVRVELADTGFPDKVALFDGNFARWATFRDSFEAAVLDRSDLKPVQKLLRLQQAVTGMAADVLGEWALRSENLPLAWAQLCGAYNNEYQTIRAHVRELFEMPTLHAESYSGLRALINTVTNANRQLASLLEPREQCEFMIMFMLEERMPFGTRTAWEMHRDTTIRPKLSDMIGCLERRATGLAGVPQIAPIVPGYKRSFRNDDISVPRTTTFDRKQQPGGRAQLPPCPLCKADHGLFRCNEFLSMKLAKRVEFVQQARLCQSCLRSGHVEGKCPRPQYACKMCKGEFHNTTICPRKKQIIDGPSPAGTNGSQQMGPHGNMSVETNTNIPQK